MVSLAFVKLEGSGTRDPDPVIATNDGIELAREERFEAAKAEFQRAINSAHIEVEAGGVVQPRDPA